MEMLENGKIYTWKEIEQAYPDKYAFITDVKEKKGEIISCRLLAISTKTEKPKYLKEYMEAGIKFECPRTTFKAPDLGIV